MSMTLERAVSDVATPVPYGAPYLRVEKLRKAYGATVALDEVTLDLLPGEVHALLGENGAGKSTLVKILNGIVRADVGTMQLDGRAYAPHSLMDARHRGVSAAFQELSLLPNLSVATNLMMPSPRKGAMGLTSARRNEEAAAALLAEFGIRSVDPRSLIGDLALAEKQRIEIVRAMSQRPKVLILDEPTAALAEPEWLFDILARVTAGGTGVLYISHRLAEVRRLCARGTVLRNGRSVRTVALTGVSDAEIFRMMVGTSQDSRATDAQRKAIGAPSLSVRALAGRRVHDVSFDVRQGEIIGVAALEGQGQRGLFRMLAGLEPASGGTVQIDGKPANLHSAAAALRSGIGFLPEERKTEGVFLGLKTSSNISLSIVDQLSRFGLVRRRREMARVAAVSQTVDLQSRYLGMRIGALSGGNQQKALLGRVMVSGAQNLVLFDPTRGVDVSTKQVIYAAIRAFVARGGCALVYSTELAELVHLVDRCLVLYGGRVVGEVPGDRLTEDRLVSLATGHGDIAE
jgi:ribose transport system ATP-binding protein